MSLLFFSHPKEPDLALFAGGELGPLARWRIERHLQQCDHCQDAVADFFHLQSEVSELAEIPPVDWNVLAREIGARVRIEAPASERETRGWSANPRFWQFGLATATVLCAFLIVRELPVMQNSLKPPAPQAESQVLDQTASDTDTALSSEPRERAKESQQAAGADESNQPVAARQFAQGVSNDALLTEAKQAAGASASEPEQRALAERATRRDESPAFEPRATGTVVPDLEAQAAPEPAVVAGQGVAIAAPSLAGQPGSQPAAAPLQDYRASAESVSVGAGQLPATETQAYRAAAPAPPPPAAPAPAEADAAFQDRLALANTRQGAAIAKQRPTAKEQNGQSGGRAELAQATKAEASGGFRRLQPSALIKKTAADDAWSPERGFTVLPAALQDPTVDVGVAADGWISIRSVDTSTSTITITDVYVP